MNYGFWERIREQAQTAGKPFFVLAPMADVTDWPFRQTIAQCGRPDVWFTEFVSATGLCSIGRDRLLPLLHFTPDEHPIVAQLFGNNPEHFYTAAKLIVQLGFDGIDINMGCPDRKVLKQGSGIALCKTPSLAQEIIRATQRGVHDAAREANAPTVIPVSVKTRLGWDAVDMQWIEALLSTELPVLTIHGRTMREMSKVPAHWETIAEVVTRGHEHGTVVIGNGDVTNYDLALARAHESGVDGIMIGRGIFHNPWIFNPATNADIKTPTERLQLLLTHTRLFHQFWNDPKNGGKNFDVLKRFYKVYVSGWDGAKDLRVELMQTRSIEEVEQIVAQHLP